MTEIEIEKIKQKMAELAPKYGLSLVFLFGSQVTGKTHKESDIDFAFISESPMGPMEIAKMQIDFSKELKLKEIELVSLKNAHPLLLKQVALNSIFLYEKTPSLFARFKIYAIKNFMEARKLLELRELSLNKYLQRI